MTAALHDNSHEACQCLSTGVERQTPSPYILLVWCSRPSSTLPSQGEPQRPAAGPHPPSNQSVVLQKGAPLLPCARRRTCRRYAPLPPCNEVLPRAGVLVTVVLGSNVLLDEVPSPTDRRGFTRPLDAPLPASPGTDSVRFLSPRRASVPRTCQEGLQGTLRVRLLLLAPSGPAASLRSVTSVASRSRPEDGGKGGGQRRTHLESHEDAVCGDALWGEQGEPHEHWQLQAPGLFLRTPVRPGLESAPCAPGCLVHQGRARGLALAAAGCAQCQVLEESAVEGGHRTPEVGSRESLLQT